MTNLRLFIFLTALLLAPLAALNAAEFYVAPNGNDAHPGTMAQPFRTPGRAVRAVRDLRPRETEPGPVTVRFRGGVYPLEEKLVFEPEDSGTASSPVTYTAFPGERVVISGGRRITGHWHRVEGRPYLRTQVPGAGKDGWMFRTMSVGGESRVCARKPNWGAKVLRADGRAPGEDERQAFRYRPGDINPAWADPGAVDIVLLQSWTPTVHRIREILPDRRGVRFRSTHGRAVDFWERNFRYYLSNVLEELDEPGEWYLDRRDGTLYYYPMPGEAMDVVEVVAPVIKSRMVEFAGDVEKRRWIEHLHFTNLELRDVDADLDKYDGTYRQGHMFLDAAIHAEGLRSSSFRDCVIAQVGEYAIELDRGCRDNRIERCHIWDIGAGAVQLGVTDLGGLLAARPKDLPADERSEAEVLSNAIDNNCIHRLGTVWHGCYGIVNRFASLTTITHNEIFDTHWDPVGLDARWNWQGEKHSHGNVVAYNHIHHYGLRYHTDSAAIYQFGPLDTHIHHNLIHHGRAYPYICGTAGIYLDAQSRNALVENNIVHHVEWSAYFQNWGVDNTFRNNIGAFARDGFIGRGGLGEGHAFNNFRAEGNIYVAGDGVGIGRRWDPGNPPPVLRRNMYHSLGGDGGLRFWGLPFAEWQAAGMDEGSAVGDPGFAHPAQGDFSFRPGAAAPQSIGFDPFTEAIAKAGLYGSDEWKSLPARQKMRQPTEIWSPGELARLIAFDLDFEDMPDGFELSEFRLAKERGATFAVTGEAAAGGLKSYRCTDRKGLAKGFYPYIHMAPRALSDVRISFAFEAMLHRSEPAAFHVEFRGGGEKPVTGPSIRFQRDGRVMANGREVGILAPGEWGRVCLSFEAGPGAAARYALAMRLAKEERNHTIPLGHEGLGELSWFGITACEDRDGVFYLDNMKLDIAPRDSAKRGGP